MTTVSVSAFASIFFYRPHPLEAKVKPLGVHLRVAKKRMRTMRNDIAAEEGKLSFEDIPIREVCM